MSDTRRIRIRGVSYFFYFREIRIRVLIRIDLVDTAYQLSWIRPSPTRSHPRRPSRDAGSPPHSRTPAPRRIPRGDAATSARRSPATGDEPPLAGDEHQALLAGDEQRPCSPVDFPRPCDVDPAPPVS